jgi:hypothetical protein
MQRGTILSLKKDLDNDELSKSCHARAQEIVKQFNKDSLPRRALCSKRFSGLTFKGELTK